MRLLDKLLSPRLIQFGIVGLSGVFVNLGMLWLFADHFGLHDLIASAIAIEISIISNFLLNNAWTFRDRNAAARTGFLARMGRFNLVSLVGLAIQLTTYYAVSRALVASLELADIGLLKYPSQLAGIALAMGWNFLSNFYWTWAQKSEPNAPAHESAAADGRPASDV